MSWFCGHINGVVVIKLIRHVDERGFLCETVRIDELPGGLQPVMSYVSYTEPGVSRGPHEHSEQTDIFSFLGPGNFLIKLWDNRKGSATYGTCMQLHGGHDSPITVIIPPGVVHGYKNISRSEQGMVINYPNRLFRGWLKREPADEIRYENSNDSPFHMEG